MDTVHECDRQTDRITITKTVQRIASQGKNTKSVDVPQLCPTDSVVPKEPLNCAASL